MFLEHAQPPSPYLDRGKNQAQWVANAKSYNPILLQ